MLVHLGWEQQWARFNASASTTRLFGDYFDLARATASNDSSALLYSTIPIASDRVTIGYSFRDWQTGVSASFIHAEYDDDRSDTNLATASLTQRLPRDVSLYLTGYADVTDNDTIGIYAGLNIPLGSRMSGGASVQTRDGVTQGAASIMKSASDAPGSVGWRAEYSEGDVRRGAASGVYMGSKAIVQGYASAQEDYAYGNVNVTGAVVAAGGGVFVGRPIYDGFAIVDAGAPDIDVYANNRLVGRTNRGGKILVPSLPAYQKNPIRIDSQDLPINAIIPTTEKQVVVARESGASISFGVDTETNAALVTFRLADGSFVPAGTAARLEGSADDAPELVVGYDGQVYFDELKSVNTVVLEMESGTCSATFASVPSPDVQQAIEAVCQ